MTKIVLPISFQIGNSIEINLSFNTNRLPCQFEKWADMGTFNIISYPLQSSKSDWSRCSSGENSTWYSDLWTILEHQRSRNLDRNETPSTCQRGSPSWIFDQSLWLNELYGNLLKGMSSSESASRLMKDVDSFLKMSCCVYLVGDNVKNSLVYLMFRYRQ